MSAPPCCCERECTRIVFILLQDELVTQTKGFVVSVKTNENPSDRSTLSQKEESERSRWGMGQRREEVIPNIMSLRNTERGPLQFIACGSGRGCLTGNTVTPGVPCKAKPLKGCQGQLNGKGRDASPRLYLFGDYHLIC